MDRGETIMDTKGEKKEILNGIYSQIGSFDNKAGLLISVLGIVFGYCFWVVVRFLWCVFEMFFYWFG